MMDQADRDRAFKDWKDRAHEAEILPAALAAGAALRRPHNRGNEYMGPCPTCGGTDRFSINVVKGKWHCRGFGGGKTAVGMLIHITGCTFLQACETLTGEPVPGRRSAAPMTDEQRAEQNRRRLEAEARTAAREAEDARYEANTQEAAQEIWNSCRPIEGTPAETYLRGRGVLVPAEVFAPPRFPIGFHPSLPYPGKGRMPALVARVDGPDGILVAVWRIFLRADGTGKADVENPKLGLGPAGGGAVRLGGIGARIGVAEGIETALGAWALSGCKYPVWATLSTAGMSGFDPPDFVKRVTIFPDGDRPMRKKAGEYVGAVPAGRKAAQALKAKLDEKFLPCVVAAEPPAGVDYLDLWNATKGDEQ